MAILSERLTQLREEKGWSKTLVAQKLGLKNMATYANYEYGTREPDIDTLKRIASLYDVTIDYLLGQNQTPKWADQRDTLDLKKFIDEDAGMTYDGDNLTEEELEQLNVAFTQIFWKRRKAERKIARDGKEE